MARKVQGLIAQDTAREIRKISLTATIQSALLLAYGVAVAMFDWFVGIGLVIVAMVIWGISMACVSRMRNCGQKVLAEEGADAPQSCRIRSTE